MSEMNRLYAAVEELKRLTGINIEALADVAAEGRLMLLTDPVAAGRVVILPCAVGDKVYCLERDRAPCVHNPAACPHSCGKYHSFDEMMKCRYICPDDVYSVCEHEVQGFVFRGVPLKLEDAGQWGYEGFECFRCEGGIFLTRKEAEEVLEKLHAEKGGGEA